MELRRENVIAGDGRGKGAGVLGRAGRERPVGWIAVVAVHEIEAARIVDALPERVRGDLPHLVPAHVGNLQAGGVLERAHLPGEEPQARRVALGAALEKHLLADAQAQERLRARGLGHRLAQAALVQAPHAVGHRPLPGKHDAVGRADAFGIRGDLHLVAGSDVDERLLHRAQVAHAVIDYRYALAHGGGTRPLRGERRYSVPLADGTRPAARASGSSAMRSARANALKTVSHWWCALSPRRLSMCTVACAWFTKPWKNSWVRSTSNSPTRARLYSTCHSSPGRPEKSTTARDSASSSGTYACP